MDKLTMKKATFTDANGALHKGWLFLWRGYELIVCEFAKGWTVFEPNTGLRVTKLRGGESIHKKRNTAVLACTGILNRKGEPFVSKMIHEHVTEESAERYIETHKAGNPGNAEIQ